MRARAQAMNVGTTMLIASSNHPLSKPAATKSDLADDRVAHWLTRWLCDLCDGRTSCPSCFKHTVPEQPPSPRQSERPPAPIAHFHMRCSARSLRLRVSAVNIHTAAEPPPPQRQSERSPSHLAHVRMRCFAGPSRALRLGGFIAPRDHQSRRRRGYRSVVRYRQGCRARQSHRKARPMAENPSSARAAVVGSSRVVRKVETMSPPMITKAME